MGYTATSNKNGFVFKLTVNQVSQNVKDNESTISFKFEMINDKPYATRWFGLEDELSYKVSINGKTYSGNIGSYYGVDENTATTKDMVLIDTKKQIIKHNNDGKKTIKVSFSVSDTSGLEYTCGSASLTKSIELKPIPKISDFSLNTTSVKVEDILKPTILSPLKSFNYKFGWYLNGNRVGNVISVNSSNPEITVLPALYEKFLDANTKSLVFSLRCGTYSGTNLIGYISKEITVSLSANRCKPIIQKIEINNIDNYKLGEIEDVPVIKEDGEIEVTISYTYGSNYYSQYIEGNNNTTFTKIKKISKLNTLIEVNDPKNFFTSNKKSLKDYENYVAYVAPTISINTPSVEFVASYEEGDEGEDIFSGYKITRFNCDIDYSYLSYKLLDSSSNSFSYRYYLGIDENNPENFTSYISPGEKDKIKISYSEDDSDMVITLNDLLSSFYLVINYKDNTTDKTETKEIKLSPLFDWGEDSFDFNIPIQINRDQKTGEAWYDLKNKTGGGINMKNSDIVGIDKLVFSDASNKIAEGIVFPRSGGKAYDCMKVVDGVLKVFPSYHPDDKTPPEADIYVPAYKKGDTITIHKNRFYLSAWYGSTAATRKIRFSIPFSKAPGVSKGSTLTFSSGRIRIITNNGAILEVKNSSNDTSSVVDFYFKITTDENVEETNIIRTGETNIGTFEVDATVQDDGITVNLTPKLNSSYSFLDPSNSETNKYKFSSGPHMAFFFNQGAELQFD